MEIVGVRFNEDGKVYYLFNNIENYIYNTGKNPTLNATQYPSIRIQGFDSSNKLAISLEIFLVVILVLLKNDLACFNKAFWSFEI